MTVASSNMKVTHHEHFFSPLVDKYEGDVLGRFDAVERADGTAWVYVPEADLWHEVSSYKEALELASECAEAW